MQAANRNSAFTEPDTATPSPASPRWIPSGVEAEVLYSEVSAFRYLADMKEG